MENLFIISEVIDEKSLLFVHCKELAPKNHHLDVFLYGYCTPLVLSRAANNVCTAYLASI